MRLRATLDLENWHDFFKCLVCAGYRSSKFVSSRNAILYTYVMFLIGKRDYRVKPHDLRRAIARWFSFVALTGRYTASPESQMEQDLADLREVSTVEGYLGWLDRTIGATFTSDYWTTTLPNELATSSARSPGLFAYYAALNLLEARVLFSELKVADLMDPATRAKRSSLERHHLFPKAFLQRQGIGGRRETNQIANYALLEWPDNNAIGDAAPAEYYPRLVEDLEWVPELREQMSWWHALPGDWYQMQYQDFLQERRKRLAEVIQAGFESLDRSVAEPIEATSLRPAKPEQHLDVTERVLELLDEELGAFVSELLEEPLKEPHELRAEVVGHTAKLEALKPFHEKLDLETARVVGDRCLQLMEFASESRPEDDRRLIQAAALYFVFDEDAESDLHSAHGFDDDLAVVEAVETVLAVPLDA